LLHFHPAQLAFSRSIALHIQRLVCVIATLAFSGGYARGLIGDGLTLQLGIYVLEQHYVSGSDPAYALAKDTDCESASAGQIETATILYHCCLK